MMRDEHADACSCAACTADWPEPDNMDMTPSGLRVADLAPVTTRNPDIERAMRQVTEADIHGAFGGTKEVGG